MLESVVIIGFCIILIIFSIWFVKQAIYFFSNKSNEKKYLGYICIFYLYSYYFLQFWEGINTMFFKNRIFVQFVIMSIRQMRNLTIALNAMQNYT